MRSSRHALVAFNALDRSTLPAGATIVPFQLRAFLPRDALPATNESGAAIRGEVDLYNANARYFVIDSTGVGGGGIVRGVMRAGDPVAGRDGFGYCDPNHLRSLARPAATWRYGSVAGTRMAGWFAARCAARATMGQDPGSGSVEPVPSTPPGSGLTPTPVAVSSSLRAGATGPCSRARLGRAIALRALRGAGVRVRRAPPGAQRRRLAWRLPAARRRAADRLGAVRRLC